MVVQYYKIGGSYIAIIHLARSRVAILSNQVFNPGLLLYDTAQLLHSVQKPNKMRFQVVF